MLAPAWKRNDKMAATLIVGFSIVVFVAVVFLSQVQLKVDLGFDVHLFAKANAIINSAVTILLISAIVAVKRGKYTAHRNMMMAAMVLSILFLLSYICHHLFAGETKFGDVDHNGLVSDLEKANAGSLRLIYFIILITHIPLAAIILPFVLFTAYRAQIGEWPLHRKLAKLTWPVWLYVAVTGVVVYLMISPYY